MVSLSGSLLLLISCSNLVPAVSKATNTDDCTGLPPTDLTSEPRAPNFKSSWTKLHRSEKDQHHELLFAVRQRNLDQLEALLLDRSDPHSPNYGKWLSGGEARNLTMDVEAVDTVKRFLERAGAQVVGATLGGELVRARATVGVWEQLLTAQFHVYRNTNNATHIAAEDFTLPVQLQGHVQGVLYVSDFPDPTVTPKRLRQASAASMTPLVIRKAYNMPPVAAAGSPEALSREKATQAVYATADQHYSPQNLKDFQKEFGLPERNVTDETAATAGSADDALCRSDSSKCGEANLDVQYMLAMSPWSQTGFWYNPPDKHFADFLVQLLDLETPPEVVSMSYTQPELGATAALVQVFNNAAMKLGLQGVTLIAASGDDGAQSTLARLKQYEDCAIFSNIGLQVSWPASSPYVTGVGATMGIESGKEEVASQLDCVLDPNKRSCDIHLATYAGSMITTGGGYSKQPRPSYQDGHVSCKGRGVPDLALAGHSYEVQVGKGSSFMDGSSASAPVFAGMVTLINAGRKAAGKPTVGFMNPALYKGSAAFNDLTKGDNKCGECDATGHCPCCGGFTAGPGWDAVTGLGSVDFAKFQNIFDSTSEEIVV